MKKYFCLLVLLMAATQICFCQLYITRAGYASFFSNAPLEDIKAENKQLFAVIDLAKKELAFTLLIKGFEFKKDLMQTHFNENYIESDKYPKANFSGNFTGDVSVASSIPTTVQVSGNITLHGVTKSISVPATLQFINGQLVGYALFKLHPADFNISIPALVKDKIAKEVEVEIKVECDPKK